MKHATRVHTCQQRLLPPSARHPSKTNVVLFLRHADHLPQQPPLLFSGDPAATQPYSVFCSVGPVRFGSWSPTMDTKCRTQCTALSTTCGCSKAGRGRSTRLVADRRLGLGSRKSFAICGDDFAILELPKAVNRQGSVAATTN